jgi:hypothetical protein
VISSRWISISAKGPSPQERVVGRQAPGEALGIGKEDLPLALDALQQFEVDPVDPGDGLQAIALGLPDEGLGAVHGRGQGRLGCEPFQGVGDAAEQGSEVVGLGRAHGDFRT